MVDNRASAPGRRPGSREPRSPEQQATPLEKVIAINRVAKVTKGGKRLSFTALVVIGDGKGHVGWACGKANEVAEAIRKGLYQARKAAFTVPMRDATIPHEVVGKFGASRILMRPAAPGTGVIAGGAVRAVCEAAGIKDILAKSLGSGTSINVVRATVCGLQSLRYPQDVVAQRMAELS